YEAAGAPALRSAPDADTRRWDGSRSGGARPARACWRASYRLPVAQPASADVALVALADAFASYNPAGDDVDVGFLPPCAGLCRCFRGSASALVTVHSGGRQHSMVRSQRRRSQPTLPRLSMAPQRVPDVAGPAYTGR